MNESKYVYPDQIEIQPVTKPVNATIRVPGSKSITNRALVLGALASREKKVKIKWILHSDDTRYMIEALRQLGFAISITENGKDVEIESTNPLVRLPARQADLYLGNSGTCMRFLAALVSLGQGAYRLDGDSRMRERPMGDLLDALRQLGVDAKAEFGNGCPPLIIRSNGTPSGKAKLRGDTSSQFLSGLLMAGPMVSGDIDIEIEGELVSKPFVEMSIKLIEQLGGKIAARALLNRFRIHGPQDYNWSGPMKVSPDATSASYFFGAAAITRGSFKAEGLKCAELRHEKLGVHHINIQNDVRFISELVKMGCDTSGAPFDISVQGGKLRGITVDMNAISDTVMTLAAVACFAEGPTTIRNVAHIRHKECDRITALCTELRKLGVEVEEYPDGLKITPRPMHGAVMETYNDHRMAMSLALIGLKVPGVVIKNPGCVAKTYPGFWEDFQKLYE